MKKREYENEDQARKGRGIQNGSKTVEQEGRKAQSGAPGTRAARAWAPPPPQPLPYE